MVSKPKVKNTHAGQDFKRKNDAMFNQRQFTCLHIFIFISAHLAN